MSSSLLLLVFRVSEADVHLPAIFGSNMVIQRNHVVPILGSALPGENVRVEFNGQSKSATANDNGRLAGNNIRQEIATLSASSTFR
jgi:hypothetical protein